MDELASLSTLLAEAETVERSLSSAIKLDERFANAKPDVSSASGSNDIKSISSHRVQWARTLHLEYILAMLFKPGTSEDGLDGIRTMTDNEIEAACTQFSLKVKSVVQKALTELKSSPSADNLSNEGVNESAGKQ